MEDIWIPTVMFVAIAVIASLYLYFRYKSRLELQKTMRDAIEKGQDLSPELMDRISDVRPPKDADLRRGVIAMAIGIGFAVFGLILDERDAVRPLIGVASFPFLIGIAYLGLWLFSKDSD